ncbi:hypothetical protein D5H75_21485 [Bailinhaonella thermotolerans]|uniref:Uncharacterized protein n=2 Tax=Bailinhaonella thermotolerans TaxID=1070861 RepID=A0A3A4AMH8_9ACTN|nr:hypothetical protein D5H75_21485 [Bailinhaonella thermotolerans]
MPSVWSLPLHTLRLLGRSILPLLIWFTAGQLARHGLLVAATELSHGSMRQLRLVFVILLFCLMVMLSLIVTAGMLYSLRGGMWEIRARREDGESDEPFIGGLGRAIIVFVGLYLTWGLAKQDVIDFYQMDVARQSAEKGYLGAWLDRTTAQGITGLDWELSLYLMGGAFVIRYLSQQWHERRESGPAAALTALFELIFTYIGMNAMITLVGGRSEWVGSRAVTVWLGEVTEELRKAIPGWEAFWNLVGEVRPYVFDSVVMSLVWLTVAILIYGAYAEDAREVIAGTRLETVATRGQALMAERTHTWTRKALARFVGRWGKWTPLANTLRLTVRAGAPLFGLFALCYVCIQVLGERIFRAGIHIIGDDHPFMFWNVALIPFDFLGELVRTTLTIALLAATFDLAATRERARNAAVSARTGEDPPGPGSANPPSPAQPPTPAAPAPR